jgi:hypothetical protein
MRLTVTQLAAIEDMHVTLLFRNRYRSDVPAAH